MSRVRFTHSPAVARMLTGTALLALTVVLLPAPASADPVTVRPAAAGRVSAAVGEDEERQAALVAAEDHRLNQVRAVTAVAPLKGLKWTKPYRLDTSGGYTLVLTERSAPYTIADLLQLAPQTFIRQSGGAYLLTENIYLNLGAKLKLSHPGGLEIRLASRSDGFVSIVSFGGGLILEGSAQTPLKIIGWDPRTGQPDTVVSDGRAYLRAIGGQFSMTFTEVSHLGFWSGRTGGISLTGTDRPNTGAIEGPGTVPNAREEPTPGEVRVLPNGELETPDSRFVVPGLSYVSGKVADSTITGNTFGLFLSSADGITVSDTKVKDSLEDGLVLHRFVSNAIIERTTSSNNHGDGFVLSRATQQVRVTDSTAEGNGGNGFTLSGQPLASGASASGESTASYGSNSVSSSTARNNGHYGIEILGGLNVSVQDNKIEGSDMGIVARQAAANVTITANRLTGQRRQGIAIRDGVTSAVITGNVIEGAETGVYVRESVVEMRGNTIHEAGNHGVTFVGDVGGSTVSFNVIAGVGPSAVDTTRADGKITLKDNQTDSWYDTSSFWIKVRHYASPMTLLWTFILLLILFVAMKGGRKIRTGAHPYSDKMPLSTTGVREIARGRARVGMAVE